MKLAWSMSGRKIKWVSRATIFGDYTRPPIARPNFFGFDFSGRQRRAFRKFIHHPEPLPDHPASRTGKSAHVSGQRKILTRKTPHDKSAWAKPPPFTSSIEPRWKTFLSWLAQKTLAFFSQMSFAQTVWKKPFSPSATSPLPAKKI